LAPPSSFISGLIGTAVLESGISQVGFLLFVLWTLVASTYLLVRPQIERTTG
jgi:hypothetical protein